MKKESNLFILLFICLINCGCCSLPEFECRPFEIINEFYDRSLLQNKAIIKGVITNQGGGPAQSDFDAKITTLLGDSTSVDTNGYFTLMFDSGIQVITFYDGKNGVIKKRNFARQSVMTVKICMEVSVSR